MTTPSNPIPPREQESLFPSLSPEVAEALDAAIEQRGLKATLSGATPTPTPAATAAQARVTRVLSLLDQLPVENPPADLVERTLMRIQTEKASAPVADDSPDGSRFRIGFRMGELAVIAAMFLVAISMVWPMLDQVRSDSRKIACANNLNVAGAAVASYASDNQSSLPNRGAIPGNVWWNVGEANDVQPVSDSVGGPPVNSNSSHLFNIVRDKYIAADDLNCPSNQNAVKALAPTLHDWPTGRSLSYSYQNQYVARPEKLESYAPLAIIADKNPLFVPRSNQRYALGFSGLPESTNNQFHGGKGQNILFRDMSAMWSTTPTLANSDNIWTINGLHDYRGTETPTKNDDTFLVP